MPFMDPLIARTKEEEESQKRVVSALNRFNLLAEPFVLVVDDDGFVDRTIKFVIHTKV